MIKYLIPLLVASAAFLHAEDVSFIAHPSTADAALDAEAIKSILIGNKTKWESGTALKLGVLKEGPVHEKVVRDYTQRSADQFDKFWKKLVFTGKGMAPATFSDDAEAVAWVAKTPGALAYVAPASVTPAVKVVATK